MRRKYMRSCVCVCVCACVCVFPVVLVDDRSDALMAARAQLK